MPAIFFGGLPAEGRGRVERASQHARICLRHVRITEAICSATRIPRSMQEMVTSAHGPISLTYAAAVQKRWIHQLAIDSAVTADRQSAKHRAGKAFQSRETDAPGLRRGAMRQAPISDPDRPGPIQP